MRQQDYETRKERPMPGGGSCPGRNEIWIIKLFGSPTGSFDISQNILGTTETLTFDADFTAAEVKTELETHTKIAVDDVACTGGPFPEVAIKVEWKGELKNHKIPEPILDTTNLVGSGSSVEISRWVPGRPKDGSVAP